jgi:hypothetical protein
LGWDDRYTPDRVWFSANDNREPRPYNTLHSQIGLQAGEWYHMATTYTPDRMGVFINGELKGTRTPNSDLGGYDNSTVRLGGGWGSYHFDGQHLSGNPAGTAPQFLDSTAYANHGTAAGSLAAADQVPGMFDGSLALGTGKHVAIANDPSLLLTGAMTLEGWMKIDELDGYIHSIVGFSDSEQRGYKLAWDKRSGANRIWFCVNDNCEPRVYNTLLANYAFEADRWYYIVATYDETLMKVYVDGELIGTRTSLSEPGAYDSSPVYIGRWYDFWFPGQLDEIRISDIARDPEWILANYRLMSSPNAYLTFGQVALVPEPSSLLLLLFGAVGLLRRHRALR